MSRAGRPQRGGTRFVMLRWLAWGAGLCGLALVFRAWLSPGVLLGLANGMFLCG